MRSRCSEGEVGGQEFGWRADPGRAHQCSLAPARNLTDRVEERRDSDAGALEVAAKVLYRINRECEYRCVWRFHSRLLPHRYLVVSVRREGLGPVTRVFLANLDARTTKLNIETSRTNTTTTLASTSSQICDPRLPSMAPPPHSKPENTLYVPLRAGEALAQY